MVFCFFTSVQITDTEKNVEFFMLLLFLGHIHQYCKISLQEIWECNFLEVKKIKRGIYCIYYICIIEILGGFMLYEMNLWKVQKTVSTWGFLFQTYIHYTPGPLLVRPPIVRISLYSTDLENIHSSHSTYYKILNSAFWQYFYSMIPIVQGSESHIFPH